MKSKAFTRQAQVYFFPPALGLFSPPGASGVWQLHGTPVPTATPAAARRPAPGDAASSCPRGLSASRGSGRGCRGTVRRGVAEAALGEGGVSRRRSLCQGQRKRQKRAQAELHLRSRAAAGQAWEAGPGTPLPTPGPPGPPDPPPGPGPAPPRGPPIATCSPAVPATPTLR